MELRLDRLLAHLRDDAESILAAIDADPLLIKRTSGEWVLANASQKLYTPQQQHQLYAKGIIYLRDPYRLVSLPLIKIYNVGERDVTVTELAEIGAEGYARDSTRAVVRAKELLGVTAGAGAAAMPPAR